ncbi:exocyst complex component 3-like protein 4 [Denticeps clupeoides]|nr:exocyst complex component 3-like [Denticeps clupeoides]
MAAKGAKETGLDNVEDSGSASPSKMDRADNNRPPAKGISKARNKGLMQSFKHSIKKRVDMKNPPIPRDTVRLRRSISDEGTCGDNLDNTPTKTSPASPSLSVDSPMYGQSGINPVNSKIPLTRTQSDSVAGRLGKRGSAIRRSLGLGSKKEKSSKPDPLQAVRETVPPTDERSEETACHRSNVSESYTLPEIPATALSVMQINGLIESEMLEEAYLNLLSLRQEFRHDLEALEDKDLPVELGRKEKDLNMLYRTMMDKLSKIVQRSCTVPSHNNELLIQVAHIIQEEERRDGEPGGVAGWRDAWRDAVRDGMGEALDRVPLQTVQQNSSWLAVHLGQLGKTILGDLEKVKTELQDSYPPSFNVFETYVTSCHDAVGGHLKTLLGQVTELKDFYALLDFITNQYSSENIMGSSSLKPEMTEKWTSLNLEDGFLEQIRRRYCQCLQENMSKTLTNVIKLESNEMWNEMKKPNIDNDLYESHIHLDIWTNIKGFFVNSKKIDGDLEQSVVQICLEQLQQFLRRFESAFTQWSSSLQDPSLKTEYYITYINCFSTLKEHIEEHMTGYEKHPEQAAQLGKEMNSLVLRLRQTLLEFFLSLVKPYLNQMMTRKWLSVDEDFKELMSRTKSLSKCTKYMRPSHAELFVNDVHYHVVKEYISQLMKNKYNCKNSKHEKAAEKIREQWTEIKDLFQEMKSTSVWLNPLGYHLSKLIGQKNKREIKTHLLPLVKDYPDISKKHLAAVLYFRGITRGRERQLILEQLSEVKRKFENYGNQQHSLFNDMPAAANTDCLAELPFSCFSHFLPSR